METSRGTVAVIGCGRAGASIAFHLTASGRISQLILNDLDQDKVSGEEFDLTDASGFQNGAPVIRQGDLRDCAAAQVAVIAAGAPRMPGQTEAENFRLTRETCLKITDGLTAGGFQGVLFLLCSKVDTVLQDIRQHFSIPAKRLIGLGNGLNAERLRLYMERCCGLEAGSVRDFYLMGNYQDPCGTFSTAIAGEHPLEQVLREKGFCPPYQELLHFPQERGSVITVLKYPTYYGVAAAVSAAAAAILGDEGRCFSLSAQLQGEYGISGLFASVPVRLGKGGAEEILELPLNREEKERFIRSAADIKQENEKYLSSEKGEMTDESIHAGMV